MINPIRHFVARLRRQANICNFFVVCPTCATNVVWTKNTKLDVLEKQNQNMTLEDVVQFVDGKEGASNPLVVCMTHKH